MLTPLEAYSNFVALKNAELIGTQRDIVRLTKRGIAFTATALDGFNDLFQYVSITATNKTKISVATKFISYLLSLNVQKRLTEINMFSTVTSGLYTSAEFASAENLTFKYTVFCLPTNDELRALKQNALTGLTNCDAEVVIKLLKQL